MLTEDAKRLGIHPTQDWRKVKLKGLQRNELLSMADALGIPDDVLDLIVAIKEKLKTGYKPPKV